MRIINKLVHQDNINEAELVELYLDLVDLFEEPFNEQIEKAMTERGSIYLSPRMIFPN